MYKHVIRQCIFGFTLGMVLAILGATTCDVKWWVSVIILNLIVAVEV